MFSGFKIAFRKPAGQFRPSRVAPVRTLHAPLPRDRYCAGHVRPSSTVITAVHCLHRWRCMISLLNPHALPATHCMAKISRFGGDRGNGSLPVEKLREAVTSICRALASVVGTAALGQSAERALFCRLLLSPSPTTQTQGHCNRQLRAISPERGHSGCRSQDNCGSNDADVRCF